MLVNARCVEYQLVTAFDNIAYDMKYLFSEMTSYRNKYSVATESYHTVEFASVDSNGIIIGYFCFGINRETNVASGVHIINFREPNYTFGKDLHQFIDDIFCKYNIRKLGFAVICGNPIEKKYDEFVEKYHGYVVGIKMQEIKLMDGKLYDIKLYEIFREDYMTAKIRVNYRRAIQ